jgi:type IV pilus assembly protein PilN
MIKINLLPFRAARKRENIRRQISIYGLIVIFTVLLIGYYSVIMIGRVSDLKDNEKKIQVELAGFEKELNEIKKLESKIKEIKVKLDVIKKLEKGKTGPVLLLADVADSVPKDKLWLTSYTENKGDLSLSGTAMDNETIALFMNNLEQTEQINTVDLESAKLRDIANYGIKVSDFVLKCSTIASEQKQIVSTTKSKSTTKKSK